MSDPESQRRLLTAHSSVPQTRSPCSSSTGVTEVRDWSLHTRYSILNPNQQLPVYEQRGRLQRSLIIRLKDKYPSAEISESQLIEFMGKKKPILAVIL